VRDYEPRCQRPCRPGFGIRGVSNALKLCPDPLETTSPTISRDESAAVLENGALYIIGGFAFVDAELAADLPDASQSNLEREWPTFLCGRNRVL
jgi:hypothetical protein